MTGRTQAGSHVIRASDRIAVELVLTSGLVIPDYVLDRPVVSPRRPTPSVQEEWLLTPGAFCRQEGGRLTLSFDVLPDDVIAGEGTISVVRTRRTINIHFENAPLAHLVDALSAGTSLATVTESLPEQFRDAARDILRNLIGWQAVTPALDARSRRAHYWSMRGAQTRGRLSASDLETLVFTRRTRNEGGATIGLAPPRHLPDDSFSAVLMQRRSPSCYNASPLALDELAQLLGHACGVTGELVMGERRLALRAYPSPGALYGVDIYLIPARIEGLPAGVFRYDSGSHALVTIHERPIEPTSFCLPDVRGVVRGAAAFIALSISIPRATRKYGDESYRILVAEAGCIAQNLVLVAHALGLRAGPFTGVFDGLVDAAIGVEEGEARFVVGVLVGREGTEC